MRIVVFDCVDVDSEDGGDEDGGDEGEIEEGDKVESLGVLISDGQTNVGDCRVAFATENQITFI